MCIVKLLQMIQNVAVDSQRQETADKIVWYLSGGMTYLMLSIPVTALVHSKSILKLTFWNSIGQYFFPLRHTNHSLGVIIIIATIDVYFKLYK